MVGRAVLRNRRCCVTCCFLVASLRAVEAVRDALQQGVHALSLFIFSSLGLMKRRELHPARNPWIRAGINEDCGDRQRTLFGHVAKRCVADACLLVRVHVSAGLPVVPSAYSRSSGISAIGWKEEDIRLAWLRRSIRAAKYGGSG